MSVPGNETATAALDPSTSAAPAVEQGRVSPDSGSAPATPSETGTIFGVAEEPQIPEKFLVKKEDGSLDEKATLQKITASYHGLEKRLGARANEVIPDNDEGYKLDYSKLPEGVQIDPEREKGFRKFMHGLGFTDKQAQGVMDRYAELIGEGLRQQAEQGIKSMQAVTEELRGIYGDKAEAQFANAKKAFIHLADEEDRKNVDRIGLDLGVTYRTLVKIMAKIGEGYNEDIPPAATGLSEKESIDSLRRSEAYLKADHPEHKQVYEKVKAYYEKTAVKKK